MVLSAWPLFRKMEACPSERPWKGIQILTLHKELSDSFHTQQVFCTLITLRAQWCWMAPLLSTGGNRLGCSRDLCRALLVMLLHFSRISWGDGRGGTIGPLGKGPIPEEGRKRTGSLEDSSSKPELFCCWLKGGLPGLPDVWRRVSGRTMWLSRSQGPQNPWSLTFPELLDQLSFPEAGLEFPEMELRLGERMPLPSSEPASSLCVFWLR